jgi:hypothetical protein
MKLIVGPPALSLPGMWWLRARLHQASASAEALAPRRSVGASRCGMGRKASMTTALCAAADLVRCAGPDAPIPAGPKGAAFFADAEADAAEDEHADLLVLVAVLGDDRIGLKFDHAQGEALAMDGACNDAIPDLLSGASLTKLEKALSGCSGGHRSRRGRSSGQGRRCRYATASGHADRETPPRSPSRNCPTRSHCRATTAAKDA